MAERLDYDQTAESNFAVETIPPRCGISDRGNAGRGECRVIVIITIIITGA